MRPLALLLLVPLFGCAHKETRSASTAPPPPAAAPAPAVAAAPAPSACAADLDCGPQQLCIRNRCVDISAGLAECSGVRVHFPFNSSEFDPGDRLALDRSARCLQADHALHVSIEGNADERGTEEYNLALGDRRATAIARYLESLGASATQLQTVSYGKERPLCTEHDEDCWAKNRRAEMKGTKTAAAQRKPKR